jgi:adenine-specific DNA-methyltransferase
LVEWEINLIEVKIAVNWFYQKFEMPSLHWIGKDKVVNHHHDVPFKIMEHQYSFPLNPRRGLEEDLSPNPLIRGNQDAENEAPPFKEAGEVTNKIIHGDNLEALKALLPEYEGKVKCIYIDPPYNTGNENWVYNDNVNHPKIKKWLHQVVGKEGEDLSRHDKWLCMMYPRLKLLHKLLREDGVIFISIDDNEQANLKLIMDEIFGGGNFVGNLIWRKKEGGGQTDKYYVTEHEYIAVYQKSIIFQWIDLIRMRSEKEFNKVDERGKYKLSKLEKWGSGARKEDRPTMHFSIKTPDNIDYYPIAPDGNDGRWRVGKERMELLNQNNLIHWEHKNNKYIPYEKTYQGIDDEVKIKERSILYNLANTADASKLLTEIFSTKDLFDTPKPFELIQFLVNHSTSSNTNDIILDSFAGSGTTAHAVLNLNKQDGGNRKFILIEMEDYAETITAERVKRVIAGYGLPPNPLVRGNEDNEQKAPPFKEAGEVKHKGTGGSFDYYTLGERLFDERGNLNEDVGVERIRQYVYFTETRKYLTPIKPPQPPKGAFGEDVSVPTQGTAIAEWDSQYLMDVHSDTAYYFYYERDQITTLDHDFLATIKTKADCYVIYADNCILSKEFLAKYNVIFKKIPRDISRL